MASKTDFDKLWASYKDHPFISPFSPEKVSSPKEGVQLTINKVTSFSTGMGLTVSFPSDDPNHSIYSVPSLIDKIMTALETKEAPQEFIAKVDGCAAGAVKHNLPLFKRLISRFSKEIAFDKLHDGDPLIITAVRTRDLFLVMALAKAGAKVDAQNQKGCTPLFVAAEIQDDTMARWLLSKVNNVDQPNQEGVTALMAASKAGSVPMVDLLIGAKATLDTQDAKGFSAITYGVNGGRSAVVKKLVEARAHVNIQAKNGWTPFMVAVERNDEQMVKVLRPKADINRAHHEGGTALTFACDKGFEKIAKMLIDAKAAVNAQDKNGTSPLRFAVERGLLSTASALLQAKAEPDLASITGRTPIMMAIIQGNEEAVSLLLQAKASPYSPSPLTGRTAIMEAASKGNRAILRVLLENTPPIKLNAQDKEGKTALWFASAEGPEENAWHLLAYDAHPNIPTRQGDTPLMAAARLGREVLVSKLLKAESDPNAVQYNKIKASATTDSAMSFARKGGFRLVVDALIDAKADLDLNSELDLDWLKKQVLKLEEVETKSMVNCIPLLNIPVSDLAGNINTLLIHAVKARSIKVVNQLLSFGADPNKIVNLLNFGAAPNKQELEKENTALMHAALLGYADIMKPLLDAKADIWVKNKAGLTVRDILNNTGLPAVTRHQLLNEAEKLQKDEKRKNYIDLLIKGLGVDESFAKESLKQDWRGCCSGKK